MPIPFPLPCGFGTWPPTAFGYFGEWDTPLFREPPLSSSKISICKLHLLSSNILSCTEKCQDFELCAAKRDSSSNGEKARLARIRSGSHSTACSCASRCRIPAPCIRNRRRRPSGKRGCSWATFAHSVSKSRLRARSLNPLSSTSTLSTPQEICPGN